MNRYQFKDEKKEHLHVLDEKPLMGTSTVLNVIAKPLTWWASGLAVAKLGWVKPLKPYDKPKPTKEEIEANAQDRLIRAGAVHQEISGMSVEKYLALLDSAYRAHADNLSETADTGTDMHAELAKYVESCIRECGGVPALLPSEHEAVKIFSAWAKENVLRFIASEAHCFSEELWTGGIVDVVYEDKESRIVILDFKSAKDAYFSHYMQDAGYAIAIEENGIFDKDGNPIMKLERSVDYYGVLPFRHKNPEPQFHFDTEGAKKGFRAAVTLHKLINNQ